MKALPIHLFRTSDSLCYRMYCSATVHSVTARHTDDIKYMSVAHRLKTNG